MQNGNTINSLNLSKVHFIITNESASASEVIINGLNPYIDVRLVGETTSGKYTGSITLYDSENFTKNGVNPNHKYAMQPIVMEGVNKLGEKSVEGYQPHIEISERVSTYGVIGDPNEPLLRTAIDDIIGVVSKVPSGKFDPMFQWDDYASSNKLKAILLIDANEELRKIISKKLFNN
jgi:C-terminal processing protease CtpA/Prc